MKQNIDLYKMVSAIGEEACLSLVGAGLVDRNTMHSILKEYKDLNKDSYTFVFNSVNDGNNIHEDYVYIESFKNFKFSHSHTMTENVDLMQLAQDDPNDSRLKLFKKSLEKVLNLHEKFGKKHSRAELLLNFLNSLNIE